MSRRNLRQEKLAKKARKEAKAKRRQVDRRRQDFGPSSPLLSGLEQAEDLLERGRVDEAAELLDELRRRFPRRREVPEMQLEVCLRQQNMWSYQAACRQILEIDPHDADIWLASAGAAMMNGQMAVAHQAFTRFLCGWPTHEMAADASENCHSLDEFLRSEIAKKRLSEDDGFELFAQHDEVNFHLHQHDYDRVCETAERLLRRWPTFAPALNNRSEANFRSGRLPAAIADARRVLVFEPGNYHALANLTRYLFLGGQPEEAAVVAQQLKAAQSESADLSVKKAETLVFLGDWSGVLDALSRAEANGDIKHVAESALLYHLAGVAAANLGNRDAARAHWKRAIGSAGGMTLAEENLNDLDQPPGEQNGPYAYSLEYWIPKAVFDRLSVDVERAGTKPKDGDVRRRVRKFLGLHPYIERLSPHLLQHGDPIAKEFVVNLASLTRLPSILAALRDISFGERGTDELRRKAALILIDAGVIPPGRHQLFVEGKMRELNLMSFEITGDALEPLPSNVEPLATKAHELLHVRNEGPAAEALLVKAIRLCPDHPSLMYNRAVAIGLQGREAEALALVRELHAKHPDYLFARVRLAQEAIAEEDFEAARALLDPCLSRGRYHLSEYTALCSAHIELLLAQGQAEGARSWLKMWRDVAPDDPRIMHWETKLKSGGLLGKLFRRVLTANARRTVVRSAIDWNCSYKSPLPLLQERGKIKTAFTSPRAATPPSAPRPRAPARSSGPSGRSTQRGQIRRSPWRRRSPRGRSRR